MKAEILAVGSELLTPFFSDTNSLFLTQRLNDLGLDVARKTIVGDDRAELLTAIREAVRRADLLFLMGGLGPTEDDRTREVCAEALGRPLVFRKDILDAIRERFRRRGMDLPASNAKQACIIEGAEVLDNRKGTAPGLWIDAGQVRIALLPGPPRELKPMFEESVWPKLQELQRGTTIRKVLKITGLTESEVEGRIAGLYPEGSAVRMTILSSPGQIELHLSEFSPSNIGLSSERIERLSREIHNRLGDMIFSATGDNLEQVVGRLLRDRGQTLATAESCTGGLLAHRLTDVPGSSAYYLAGFVTYSNQAKSRDLEVPGEWFQSYGAVSAEVAAAMARGARRRTGTGFALAITGISGPAGGTPEKPVGLVYTSLAWDGGEETQKSVFLGQRDQVKFQSTQKALDMLRRHLLGVVRPC